jgi:hypothetical protein
MSNLVLLNTDQKGLNIALLHHYLKAKTGKSSGYLNKRLSLEKGRRFSYGDYRT